MAGHAPFFAGFDTNVMPWRFDRLLGLHDPNGGVGYINGFILATEVRDELDWDYKCQDTDPFVEAFGDGFEAYWNQPLGAARIGGLGMISYRRIRDIEQAVEIESEEGDEAIIIAYDAYDQGYRSEILLFSNDRNFIERARAHSIFGHRVEFPGEFPDKATASWRDIETFALHARGRVRVHRGSRCNYLRRVAGERRTRLAARAPRARRPASDTGIEPRRGPLHRRILR